MKYSVKVHNLMAFFAVLILFLIVLVGSCAFAWVAFGWFCGAAMTAWVGAFLARCGSFVC